MFIWPKEIPWEEYVRLYFLEKTLRKFIVDSLSALDEKWWRRRVPGDIRKKAEERKTKETEKLVVTIDLHPIWYVDFLDYISIITQKNNWEEVFKRVFLNKDKFRVLMEELAPIRNKIAHMRPLSEREKKNLDALSEDILVHIWTRVYNERYVKPSETLMKQGKIKQAEKILLCGFEETGDPWIAYKLGEMFLKTNNLIRAKKYFLYAVKHLPLRRYKNKAVGKLEEVKKRMKIKD